MDKNDLHKLVEAGITVVKAFTLCEHDKGRMLWIAFQTLVKEYQSEHEIFKWASRAEAQIPKTVEDLI